MADQLALNMYVPGTRAYQFIDLKTLSALPY